MLIFINKNKHCKARVLINAPAGKRVARSEKNIISVEKIITFLFQYHDMN